MTSRVKGRWSVLTTLVIAQLGVAACGDVCGFYSDDFIPADRQTQADAAAVDRADLPDAAVFDAAPDVASSTDTVVVDSAVYDRIADRISDVTSGFDVTPADVFEDAGAPDIAPADTTSADTVLEDAGTSSTTVHWNQLGQSASGAGVSQRSVNANCPRIAVDDAGTPYVAWADTSATTQEVYLRFWDGSGWSALAQSDSNGGVSQGAGAVPQGVQYTCLGDIAFHAAGQPEVTWMNYDGSQKPTYLRRYEHGAWNEVFGSASGSGISGSHLTWWPSSAVDSQQRAVVVWQKNSEIYLVREDVDGWTGLGGSAGFPGIFGEQAFPQLPSVAIGPNDSPYVAWTDQRHGVNSAFFIRWDGSRWAGLASSTEADLLSDTTYPCSRVALAESGSGHPVVVWTQDEDVLGDTLQIRQWDGSAWIGIGTGSSGAIDLANTSVRQAALALDVNGRPVVSWTQDDALGANVYAAKRTAQGWVALSGDEGVSASAQNSLWSQIATSADGRIYISWSENTANGTQLYLKYGR